MTRQKTFFMVSVLLYIVLLSGQCFSAVSTGNTSVSIFANTNPVEEFSRAVLYDYNDSNPDIAVKLPDYTQFYILNHPLRFMPGWSAEKAQDNNDVTVTSPDGLKYIYPESMNHKLSVIRNANDVNIVIFDYNDTDPNLIDRQIDALDPNYYIQYDYNDSFLETLTLWSGDDFREYTLQYDDNNKVIAVSGSCESCGGNGQYKYEYNDDGLLQYVKDFNDNVVYEYAYNSDGWVTDYYLGEANDSNHIQRYEYTYVDANTFIVDIYDYVDINRYRLTREYRNSAGIAIKRIKYENFNENPSYPNGETFIEHIVYYYDSNGVTTKKVVIPPLGDTNEPDPNSISGIRKEYTYDANAGSLLTEKWYDVNNSDINVSSYTYDYVMTEDGNDVFEARVITYTDARGAVTEYTYDGNNVSPKLKIMPEVTSGVSGTLQLEYEYEYDNRNRITLEKQLDDSNQILVQTKYEYDDYGNLLNRYDDYGDSNELTEYRYNGFHQTTRTILPSGVVSGNSYNNNGKLESEFILADANDISDTEPNLISQTKYYYNDSGRIERIARAEDDGIFEFGQPAGWIWTGYEYDLRGNKTKVTEDVNGFGLEATYEYNNQGEVVKVTLPSGKWTRTYRDGVGLVARTEIGYGSKVEAATQLKYDANGNLIEQVSPDGVKTKYEYDDFDRVKKIIRGL